MAQKRKTPRRPSRSAPKRKPAAKKRALWLPWPVVFLLMLVVGVLLAGWTLKAGADDLAVKARIPAAPLTTAPVINYPSDGAHLTEQITAVRGTCEMNSYLKIYKNSSFSGSVLCASDSTFEINISLFPGRNDLVAHSFNITDDEGPVSNTVSVYYDIPQSQPPIRVPPNTTVNKVPFTISTDFKYAGIHAGQSVQWKLDISGGYAPYAVNVDWGDGTNSIYSQKQAGELLVEHKYKTAGSGNRNSYTIKITGSDYANQQAYLEVFVIVNSDNLPAIIGGIKPPGSNWLIVAWPAYIVALLMLTSFWLGEKEELFSLKRRGFLQFKR